MARGRPPARLASARQLAIERTSSDASGQQPLSSVSAKLRPLAMTRAIHRSRSKSYSRDFMALLVPTCYSARFRFLLGSCWVPPHGRRSETEMEEQHRDTSAVGDRCVEHCARLLGDHNERSPCIEHV